MVNIDLARLADVLSRVNPGVARTVVMPLVIALIPVIVRRVKRTRSDDYACHVAAAMAVAFGVTGLVTGVAHSAAVASLALGEPEYGPLQMLRFTTGELMLYVGAMNLALCRTIWAGRGWAIAAALWSNLLFLLHLGVVFSLPGTGGTVPVALGIWGVYFLWLGAAGFASWRKYRRALSTVQFAAA
jgi:hypothetical protein